MDERKQALAILIEDLAIQQIATLSALRRGQQVADRLRTTLVSNYKTKKRTAARRLDFAARITGMLDRVEEQRSFLRRLADSQALQIAYYTAPSSAKRRTTRAGSKGRTP